MSGAGVEETPPRTYLHQSSTVERAQDVERACSRFREERKRAKEERYMRVVRVGGCMSVGGLVFWVLLTWMGLAFVGALGIFVGVRARTHTSDIARTTRT